MKAIYSAPSIKMMQMNMEQAIMALSSLSDKGATEVYDTRIF